MLYHVPVGYGPHACMVVVLGINAPVLWKYVQHLKEHVIIYFFDQYESIEIMYTISQNVQMRVQGTYTQLDQVDYCVKSQGVV